MAPQLLAPERKLRLQHLVGLCAEREERMTEARGAPDRRLAATGHPDARIRLLIGTGGGTRLRHAIEPPLVRDPVFRPQTLHEREPLLEAAYSLCHRTARGLEFLRPVAETD